MLALRYSLLLYGVSLVLCGKVLAQGRDDFNSSLWLNQHVDIITVNEPGVRHACRIAAHDVMSITCKAKRHRSPMVYQRGEIATLIEPPTHAQRNGTIDFFLIAGAAVAGSFFVPVGWAIALRVIAVYCAWTPAWAEGPSDHNGDKILYTRPTAPSPTS